MIYESGTDDPEKADVIMAELGRNIVMSRKTYNIYMNEQKTLFLYLLNSEFFNAVPAEERAGINARTAQDWVQQMKEDPKWDIYKLTNRNNSRTSQLWEKHKHFLINLFDE